jgi:hypothetical protein
LRRSSHHPLRSEVVKFPIALNCRTSIGESRHSLHLHPSAYTVSGVMKCTITLTVGLRGITHISMQNHGNHEIPEFIVPCVWVVYKNLTFNPALSQGYFVTKIDAKPIAKNTFFSFAVVLLECPISTSQTNYVIK